MAEFSGQLSLRAEARPDGRTVLAAQSFRAPYHISKPYWDEDAKTLLVQVVNPTAGILSGDQLESDIAVGPSARLLVTTPSASRVFKMKDGTAECRQHFRVEANGWLEFMPEPLVPHRGSRYRQTTLIDVAPGGALFFADLLMPGRVGHGEAWEWSALALETEVYLGDELILRERFDHSGADLLALAEFTKSGATACFGNALLIADGPADWLPAVTALHRDGVWVGVSTLRRGGWSLKCVSPDNLHLRETLKEIRRLLVPHYPALRCDARKL